MGRSGPSSRGSGRAGDALETRLENGCSTHGLDDVPPETRAAVLALRASWKFFSVQSFCHTFRAVLRLPNFTGDELERALMDPASEPFIVEVILRLLEDAPSRGPRLAVNDWEARLADKIQRIANESDYFEEDYPPTTVAAPSEEVADDVAPEGAAEAEGEDAPREEEDAPSSLSGPASSSTSEEAVVYGHPLQNGRAFFEHLTAMERLDVVAALCEECLDANEASRAEVEAMAAAHAVADGAHPEAHGDAVATDAENRAYHACGEDVRLYRWERPTGKGKNNARGSLDPAFATPCVTLGEVRALAASLGDPPAKKDRALRDYLLQHHIPPHEALEAKAERARLAEAARAEEREVRRLAREAYDATDRKRSGRIARKIAEDLERRRIAAEAEEAEAEVRAIVQARDERLALERWRWMLLPPRLRPDEAPEGMSDARERRGRKPREDPLARLGRRRRGFVRQDPLGRGRGVVPRRDRVLRRGLRDARGSVPRGRRRGDASPGRGEDSRRAERAPRLPRGPPRPAPGDAAPGPRAKGRAERAPVPERALRARDGM